MTTLSRYFRAFWQTLYVMMRGGKLPEEAHIPYRRWSERTSALVASCIAVADARGIDQTGRKTLRVKVDGREMTLQTVLDAIAFHAKEEYAYLLKHPTENSLTTIYATNLNDTYALNRFIEHGDLADVSVRGTLVTLHLHLQQIPHKN